MSVRASAVDVRGCFFRICFLHHPDDAKDIVAPQIFPPERTIFPHYFRLCLSKGCIFSMFLYTPCYTICMLSSHQPAPIPCLGPAFTPFVDLNCLSPRWGLIKQAQNLCDAPISIHLIKYDRQNSLIGDQCTATPLYDSPIKDP